MPSTDRAGSKVLFDTTAMGAAIVLLGPKVGWLPATIAALFLPMFLSLLRGITREFLVGYRGTSQEQSVPLINNFATSTLAGAIFLLMLHSNDRVTLDGILSNTGFRPPKTIATTSPIAGPITQGASDPPQGGVVTHNLVPYHGVVLPSSPTAIASAPEIAGSLGPYPQNQSPQNDQSFYFESRVGKYSSPPTDVYSPSPSSLDNTPSSRYSQNDDSYISQRAETGFTRRQDQYGNWYEQPPDSSFVRDEKTGQQCFQYGNFIECQ